MAVLFLPIAFNMETIYKWARPEAANDAVIQAKAAYLNVNAFYTRFAIYFVLLGGLAFLLNRWSKEQDAEPTRLPGPKDSRLRVFVGARDSRSTCSSSRS